MKRINLFLLLLLSTLSFAQSWQSKDVVRIENTESSFHYTFYDSTTLYIQKQNVSYIVSLPNSNYIQVGYLYEGATSKIMSCTYNTLTQPVLSSNSELVDTLNAWLNEPSSGGGGGSQTLSISNDTLTISNGNSVILPIYFQSDSATITSYDVLNSQNAPPISPNTGDTYLVGTSPSGAWVGHAKDIAEWNGSSWDFTDGVQGDFLYNATTALTYIFRSGNWVQTTGIPALNNGNTISSGLKIGTNNLKSLTFETNNKSVSRFDSIGRFYVYDTALRKSNKFLQIDSSTGRLIASDILNSSSSSALFPNGIEFVSASRDFQASDAGKLLILSEDGVEMSMPEIFPFQDNDILYVKPSGFESKFQFKYQDNYFEGLNSGNGQPELLKLGAINQGIIILSEAALFSDKTALRYLYDQSQNVIPLSGTEVGKPVTGDIEVSEGIRFKTANADNNEYNGITLNTGGLYLYTNQDNGAVTTSLQLQSSDRIFVTSNNPSFRGLAGEQDFTANITDFDYTQKIYVGFRGIATLSSGTVTVTTDKIKTGYKIYLSVNTPSGTQGFLSAPTGSIVDETEFVINSTSATDDSTVNWWIAP